MGRDTDSFKYAQAAADIQALIRSGALRPGDALPSVREFSRRNGVSITTVLQAYYQLEAQGVIEARPRSGFYVRATLPVALPEPEISSPPPDPADVSVRDLVMMMLRDTLNPTLTHFGFAHPNPELTATKKLNHVLSRVARALGDEGGKYELPPGPKPLRAQIARRVVAMGCNLSPDEFVTTSGCADAINLCLRAVCRPGDIVAVESPICFDELQYLEVLGLRALEIPTHPRDGISLEALRFALMHNPVRACVVISNYNNPLGSCIPDENKRELVNMLAKHEIPLIENNIFGELYFGDGPPTVAKAYDRKRLVMLCSSFSKDLSPAYRVGWTAPGRFQHEIEWLKYISSVAPPTLEQFAIAEFMKGGAYAQHLRRARQGYAQRVASMLRAVMRHFPPGSRVTRPSGGFVLWVQLPEGVDSLDLYKRALQQRIAITPGYLFSATDRYRDFIRLNAATWTDASEGAIHLLGELVAEMEGYVRAKARSATHPHPIR